MRVKVLTLAVLASIVALPVPASQMLTGTFSAPSPVVTHSGQTADLVLLLSDPFLIDRMSLERPASHVALDTALRQAAL
jgi:hypothetical protein